MAESRAHVEKAQKNELFYRFCHEGRERFNEWAVVTLFYAALHYVDAVSRILSYFEVSIANARD